MGIRLDPFRAKVYGMMQMNAGPPLHITISNETGNVEIYRDLTDEDRNLYEVPEGAVRRLLLDLDRDYFDELTAREILTKAGVPINESAGKALPNT